MTNLWQQSKAALELWMQVRSTAYALVQLLALKLWEFFPLMEIAPWRKGALITAGLFGQWMRIQFIGLRVRDACNPKSGNFVMPFPSRISVCSVEVCGIAFVGFESCSLRLSCLASMDNSGRQATACV